MKKILLFLHLSVAAVFVSAQVNYNDSREDFMKSVQQGKKYRAHIAKEKIMSVKIYTYKRNDSTGFLQYESRYDGKGNNTEWFMYRHGKVKTHRTSKFDDSSRITGNIVCNGSGKQKSMNVITYDNSGNLIEQDIYKSDPKIISSKTIKTYDSHNNITEVKEYGKSGKLKSRIEYSYYEDGSKKQTVQYSGAGKVERIWNFDCNPVGKLEASKLKDTSKICIHYEKDKDGNPIKVKEEYFGAGLFGFSYRAVTKYDKDNNIIDVAYYKFNGKQIAHWGATFNASGNITEFILYKVGTQEAFNRTTYIYNAAGNVTETVVYKKTTVPYSTMRYVYSTLLKLPPR